MDEVSSNFKAIVTTNSARLSLRRIGGAIRLANDRYRVRTLESHDDDRGAYDVRNKTFEEWLATMDAIVALSQIPIELNQAHGDYLKSTALISFDNRANEAALDRIRLDDDKCLLYG